MAATGGTRRPIGLAVLVIVTGALGFIAAFALTVEKFVLLENPSAPLGCDFSPFVQCSSNLASTEGAVFGFPNPLLGIAGYAIVVVVGVGVLAGARFARWFWLVFNLGLLGAIGFVGWLIRVSVFELGTLCPWCMLVWAVTIPLFLAVTLYNVRSGSIPLPARARRVIGNAYSWLPFITLLCYILVAVIAQVQLDVLRRL